MSTDPQPPREPILYVEDLIYYVSRGCVSEIVTDFRDQLREILNYWVARVQVTSGAEQEEARQQAWNTVSLIRQLI